MKKYNTKPIDFTGCHPVIAEHLERGEAIECFAWDEEGEPKVKGWVYGYVPDTAYKYKIKEGGYACAVPIPVKVKTKRIMPPERAIPVLIAEGWSFDDSGDLIAEGWSFDDSGDLVGYATNVLNIMFKLMGRPLSDPEVSEWEWPPCIIEEVEDI